MKDQNHKIDIKKNIKPILLVIACTIFSSLGQILWKIGSSHITDFTSIITNVALILGCISYGIGAILLIIALKYGELSLIYPFIALSFIWVTLASVYLFGEGVHLFNWLGIIAILFGVSLVGYGSSR